MNKSMKGFVIASAVASLFASAAVAGDKPAAKKSTKVAAKIRCGGINECKGTGECGGANSSCAGTNECKGKGWVQVLEKECKDKGGKVL